MLNIIIFPIMNEKSAADTRKRKIVIHIHTPADMATTSKSFQKSLSIFQANTNHAPYHFEKLPIIPKRVFPTLSFSQEKPYAQSPTKHPARHYGTRKYTTRELPTSYHSLRYPFTYKIDDYPIARRLPIFTKRSLSEDKRFITSALTSESFK
jgi:hypothetical protein